MKVIKNTKRSKDWIKKMWYIYIYTMEILFNHKEAWNNAICSNMDGLEIIPSNNSITITSEVKDKFHMRSLICGI